MITARVKSGEAIKIGNEQEIIIDFDSIRGNTVGVRVTTPDGFPVQIGGLTVTFQDKETTARTKNLHGPYREMEISLG